MEPTLVFFISKSVKTILLSMLTLSLVLIACITTHAIDIKKSLQKEIRKEYLQDTQTIVRNDSTFYYVEYKK